MQVFSMANDSGLNPVTPHSSARSCTAVPIKPRHRPSRWLSYARHSTRGSAPGTPGWRRPWGCHVPGAVSPRPLLAVAGAAAACAGRPALPGVPHQPQCLALAPQPPVPRVSSPLLAAQLPAPSSHCPKKLTKLKLFSFLRSL